MTVLAKVNQITKTIKNMGRFRQIVGVFAKHGFADLIKRSGLSGFIPSQIKVRLDVSVELSASTRLRLAFEELGPTFIKLGQVLATRADLLPADLIEEMKRLQDKAPPFPYEEVQKIIEQELKGPWSDFFQVIEKESLAAASISQVHGAITLDGKDAVIKVQRPNIHKEIKTDMEILAFFASWLEETIPEIRIFSPRAVIKEFSRTLKEEIDFRIEANNVRRIRQNLREFKDVVIPEVYSTYSSTRVLTLERIRGIRIDDVHELKSKNINLVRTVQTGMDAFLHMVLVDGLFHCDLHAGNVFILEDGRIGLIDFGSVGRLSQRVRDQLIHLFLALFTENYENLAYSHLELAPASSTHVDIEAFQKDLIDTLSPVYGMNIKELDAGKVLMESAIVANRHHLEIPRDLVLLFRALVTVQSMARSLNPDFDIVASSGKHIKTVLQVRYGKERMLNDLMLLARDSFDLVQMIPKQFRMLMRRFYHNQIGFQHSLPQLSKAMHVFSQHHQFRTYLMVACAFFFIGQHKLDSTTGPIFFELSLYVWLPWLAAFGFLALSFWNWLALRKNKF